MEGEKARGLGVYEGRKITRGHGQGRKRGGARWACGAEGENMRGRRGRAATEKFEKNQLDGGNSGEHRLIDETGG